MASSTIPSGMALLSSSDLIVGQEIGKGRFKQVCRGTLRRKGGDDRDVVVLRYAKTPKGGPPSSGASERREMQVLGLLTRHPRSRPFVPEIYGACDDRRETLVLQERAVWGSLKAAICSEEAEQFTAAHKLRAAGQIARAMGFLESVRIVHADLSCRNCLLFRMEADDPGGVLVKVTDFGLALVVREGMDGEMRKQPQATRWCAPETVAHSRLSFRSDVWALGATIWELFSGGATPWPRWQKRANVAARLRTLAEVAEADAAAGGGTREAEVEDQNLSEDFPPFPGAEDQYHQDGTILAAARDAALSCLRVAERARPRAGRLADTLEQLAEESEGKCGAHFGEVNGITSWPATGATQTPEDGVTPSGGSLATSSAAGQEEMVFGPNGAVVGTTSASTPSTSATPTAPWAFNHPDWSKQVKVNTAEGELFASRCEALRNFLTSSRAMDLLGDDGAMEAFQDFIQARLQELRRPAWKDDSQSVTPRTVTALADVLVPLAADGLPADYFGGLATTQGPAEAWTVRSLAGPALLRRQDFACEADAWAAFDAVAGSGAPCVLRNPAGADVAKWSWLVVDRLAAGAAPVSATPVPSCMSTVSSLNCSRHASPLMPREDLLNSTVGRSRRFTVANGQDSMFAPVTYSASCPPAAVVVTPQYTPHKPRSSLAPPPVTYMSPVRQG